MKKAVFLDRDGVINEEVGHITSPKQIKLIKNSAKAISILNKRFKVFIITNQAAVGRGLCKEEDIEKINNHLISLLKEENASIEGIYCCFNHPIHGIWEYKKECNFRKPKPGMILQAAKENCINLKNSFMVGDKMSDIKAGSLTGLKTILVKTGHNGDNEFKDTNPDYVAQDLYDAVKIIFTEEEK